MPESHRPSPEQPPLHPPEVVEGGPLSHVHMIVSPTLMVDVLVWLTWSTKFRPPPCPTSTVRVAAFAAAANSARTNIPATAARTLTHTELFTVRMTSSLLWKHGRERNEVGRL